MEIKLKKEHLAILRKYCSLGLSPNDLLENKNKVTLAGNKQYFENLLDEISGVLTDNGMNDNDEPNELGLQIEDIIDVLSKVVYYE